MNRQTTRFENLIQSSLKHLNFHCKIAVECEIESEIIEKYKQVIFLIGSIKNITNEFNLRINYITQFSSHIEFIVGQLPFRAYTENGNVSFLEHNKLHRGLELKRSLDTINE